ncbi:cytochrome P450 2H1-like [Sceloporus undulatus]|uniref:cytochrome P450 2H1-like n=1 Tax=Sceloporus undulatus TaxID=8520 RepID=UPI001C4C758E|nr:cytochrome P450 2H1-like [Sceloporus undulatus]
MQRARRATMALVRQGWQNGSGGPRLPPGPRPLPFLGNILQVDTKNFPKSVEELSRTFGPVFTIHLGSQRAVVLYGQEVVREALLDRGEDFGTRGMTPILDKLAGGTGIGFSNGETWRQLRQFATATLRDLEKWTEERIQEEARFLVERLWSMKGRPLDPSLLLSQVTTNILCAVAFGSRFHYEDQEFLRFLHLLEENARLQSSTMTKLYNVFPSVLDYLPGSHQTIFRNTSELRHFISRRVKKEAPQPEAPQGFIDAFLLKMEQEKQNSQSVFSLQSLERSTLDFFVAGAESTSLVLMYALLALMKYPEVQERVCQEIDRVLGPSQSPCLADLSQMPYMDAVIHEVHRSLALVPLNVPHAVTKDTIFRQYLIPKGTTVFPALKASLYDRTEFPCPERFDPGHFLDRKGALRRSECFIPFSTGPRACLGERLASTVIFICLATLLQHFKLRPHVPPEELDLSPTVGFLTAAPKPYRLSLEPRW